MMEQIQEKLLSYIKQNFAIDEEEIFLEESLIDQGIIDSVGLLEIISFIEEEFSFKVDQEQMVRENFGSVIRIVNFISHEINNQNTLYNVA